MLKIAKKEKIPFRLASKEVQEQVQWLHEIEDFLEILSSVVATLGGCLGEKLGIPFAKTGKDAVMSACGENGKPPRFNKYSGVVEWVNSIFLWVNVGCKIRGQFDNKFRSDGKIITWFGGSKMTGGE
jgi:hypothetical protein